jgi:hypothetical protein
MPITRQPAKLTLVPPRLDENATERKRVLNILAQRRYRKQHYSLKLVIITNLNREKKKGADPSFGIARCK